MGRGVPFLDVRFLAVCAPTQASKVLVIVKGLKGFCATGVVWRQKPQQRRRIKMVQNVILVFFRRRLSQRPAVEELESRNILKRKYFNYWHVAKAKYHWMNCDDNPAISTATMQPMQTFSGRRHSFITKLWFESQKNDNVFAEYCVVGGSFQNKTIPLLFLTLI